MIGVQRHDRDQHPVRLHGATGNSLGPAEVSGDVDDHIVVVVTIPDTTDPRRVRRARVSEKAKTHEHSDQPRYQWPKGHWEAHHSLLPPIRDACQAAHECHRGEPPTTTISTPPTVRLPSTCQTGATLPASAAHRRRVMITTSLDGFASRRASSSGPISTIRRRR